MKYLSLILLSFLGLIFGTKSWCQNEGNIWYFGQNAGIDFNSGTAVALADGAMQTLEGCASICDNIGNLLFYTDGSTVYNANHQVMPNGTGLFGNSSSTQSAIIVNKPGSNTIYYIFTADAAENSGAAGVCYSEVDMSLQGGLGDVISQNNLISGPSTEKITAVQHQNGIDYWIVTPNPTQTTFHSFLLTSAGVNLTPVVSTGVSFTYALAGYLKASPNGNKLATSTAGATELFDFDKSTGLASNQFVFSSGSYGIEFSPSNQFVYVSDFGNAGNVLVMQYDLLAGSNADIAASGSAIDSLPTTFFGAFQLAPDGKIYISELQAGFSGLSTIENPDLQGAAANFQHNSFALAQGTSQNYGLPNFYNQASYGQTDFNICEGDSVYLYDPFFQSHNWSVSTNPNIVFSTDTAITVSPTVNTTYWLIDGADTAVFNFTVSPSFMVDLGPDIENCDQSNIDLFDLNNSGNANLNFVWQDGTTNDTLTTNLNGLYWLTVSSDVCSDSDTIEIFAAPGVSVSPNDPICFGTPTGSIIVNVPGSTSDFTFVIEDAAGNTVNAAGTNVANNLLAGWYQITYTNTAGCTGVTSVQLVDPPLIQITLSLTDPLCYGDAGGAAKVANLIGYQGDFDAINFVWTPNPQNNNGLLTDSIFNLSAGEYNIEIIDDFGCINSQVFYITEPDPLEAVITDNIPTFCRTAGFQSGNGVLAAEVPAATAGTPPLSFNWLNLADDQSANTSTVVMRSPGQVVLTITDANSCTYVDTVQLDSLNPIADFIIESDQFDIPNVYEGTELLTIDVTNLSQNFAQAINPNSDTIFQLNLNTNGPNGGNWFFSYDLDEKIDTTYEGEAVYQVCLITKNYNDCADTLCQDVTVFAFPELIAPNVFTPGSSPNSHFYFPARGIAEFECTIFNRYGIVVYEFNSIADQWDGNHFRSNNVCSEGVYSYVYKAKSTNGTPFQGEGQVTLVR